MVREHKAECSLAHIPATYDACYHFGRGCTAVLSGGFQESASFTTTTATPIQTRPGHPHSLSRTPSRTPVPGLQPIASSHNTGLCGPEQRFSGTRGGQPCTSPATVRLPRLLPTGSGTPNLNADGRQVRASSKLDNQPGAPRRAEQREFPSRPRLSPQNTFPPDAASGSGCTGFAPSSSPSPPTSRPGFSRPHTARAWEKRTLSDAPSHGEDASICFPATGARKRKRRQAG